MGVSPNSITYFLGYFTIICVILLFVFPMIHRHLFYCFKKISSKCLPQAKRDISASADVSLVNYPLLNSSQDL